MRNDSMVGERKLIDPYIQGDQDSSDACETKNKNKNLGLKAKQCFQWSAMSGERVT